MSGSELAARTVVVTRGEKQSASLREALAARGARVIAVPTIRFTVAADLRDWEEALARRREFTHVVFTSQNAADFFLELSARAGVPLSFWRERRIAAIGVRTAARLEERGLAPHFRPAKSTGIGLATELVERERVGPASVVLLPQSAIARPEVADYLEAAGATVCAAPVYETRSEDPGRAAPLFEALDRGAPVDAVTFSSPSALQALLDMTGHRGRLLLEAESTRLVSIGPTTSRAIREAGLEVAAEARAPDMDALVEAVIRAVEA